MQNDGAFGLMFISSSAIVTSCYRFTPTESIYGDLISPTVKRTYVFMQSARYFRPILSKSASPW